MGIALNRNFDTLIWSQKHATAGRYAAGIVVIDPVNGKNYVGNDAATKGSAVDLSISPSAGDGTASSDWILATKEEADFIGNANTFGGLIALRNSNLNSSKNDRYFLNFDQVGTGDADNPQYPRGEYVQNADRSLSLVIAHPLPASVDQEFTKDSALAQSGVAMLDVINHHHIPEEYGLVGDYSLSAGGGTNNSPMLQALVDDMDSGLVPYIHLPARTENYRLDQPVVIQEPDFHIYTDRGPAYNRGNQKNGNIIVGVGTHALQVGDVGPTDTVNTRSGMYSFEGLSFLPYNFAPQKSKTGVKLDRQTNGPDRGIIFDKISGRALESVIHVVPARPGVTTALANLVIKNSCLSNNRYGLLSEAPVFGLHFVNNQAEHNNNGTGVDGYDGGAVHGDIGGGIVIEDNMLEGQPNAINLTPSVHSMRLSFKRNYVEKNEINNSQYVIRLKTEQIFHNNHATIGPNFFSGVVPDDYCIIEGRGSWTLELHDRYAITFKGLLGAIHYGSRIFNQEIKHFRLNQLDPIKFPEIYLNEGGSIDTSGREIQTLTVTNGGAGYTDGETVTLNAVAGGYGATGVVTAAGGVVTAIAVTEPGYGYSNTDVINIGTGGGTATATVSPGDWVHVAHSEGALTDTPFGQVLAQDGRKGIEVPLAISAGDLVVLNILVYAGDIQDQLFAGVRNLADTNITAFGFSNVDRVSAGHWVVMCVPFISSIDETSFVYGLGHASGVVNGVADVLIAGISARNYGSYTNDGTDTREIRPVMPRVFQ